MLTEGEILQQTGIIIIKINPTNIAFLLVFLINMTIHINGKKRENKKEKIYLILFVCSMSMKNHNTKCHSHQSLYTLPLVAVVIDDAAKNG
jgi:hypothetical protein